MKFGSSTSLTINKIMSRVGKKPILIPAGVEVKIEGSTVKVKGPKGELQLEIRPELKIELKENNLILSLAQTDSQAGALWGLYRMLVANLVEGVTKGFEKKLEIEGVGYKATLEGENLVLLVGFSHPVKLLIPQELKVVIEKNLITVSGISKADVGQFAAIVRKVKPCEPYKGKGLKYLGEKVRRKVGKKVVATKG